MEVDKTIKDLCVFIQKKMTVTDMDTAEDVAKLTSALAQLVAARANTY